MFRTLIWIILVTVSCGNAEPNNLVVADRNGRIYGEIKVLKKQIIDFPVSLLNFESGQLLVFDKSQQIIRIYDEELQESKSFGKKGPGPAEFSRVRAVSFFGNQKLIALDEVQNSIKVFSFPDGELVDFYKVPISFERGIFLKEDSSIILQRTGPNFTLDFAKVNYRNDEWLIEEQLSADTIFSDLEGSSIRDDGFFAKNVVGQVFYVSYLSSNTYRINNSGEVEKRGKAIHDIINPEVIVEGRSAYPGTSEIYVAGIAADRNYLYIVDRLPDENGNLVLDCYNANSLEYVQSFALPYLDEMEIESIGLIDVDDSVIYGTTENYLLKLKIVIN